MNISSFFIERAILCDVLAILITAAEYCDAGAPISE